MFFTYVHKGELPRPWTMKLPSTPKKMSRPATNKYHIIVLDDVDGCWNNAFTNFEVEVKLMGKNLQAMMSRTLEMMLPQFKMKCKWWHIND
jgi:hypothetical protein